MAESRLGPLRDGGERRLQPAFEPRMAKRLAVQHLPERRPEAEHDRRARSDRENDEHPRHPSRSFVEMLVRGSTEREEVAAPDVQAGAERGEHASGPEPW